MGLFHLLGRIKKLSLINSKKRNIAEVEKGLNRMLASLIAVWRPCRAWTRLRRAALIANIGDVRRFGSADKLARFAGVAPVRFISAGKGKVPGRPRNPVFHDYYHRKIAEGTTKKQARVCVMRRLVRHDETLTAYVMPELPEKEAV